MAELSFGDACRRYMESPWAKAVMQDIHRAVFGPAPGSELPPGSVIQWDEVKPEGVIRVDGRFPVGDAQ